MYLYFAYYSINSYLLTTDFVFGTVVGAGHKRVNETCSLFKITVKKSKWKDKRSELLENCMYFFSKYIKANYL